MRAEKTMRSMKNRGIRHQLGKHPVCAKRHRSRKKSHKESQAKEGLAISQVGGMKELGSQSASGTWEEDINCRKKTKKNRA